MEDNKKFSGARNYNVKVYKILRLDSYLKSLGIDTIKFDEVQWEQLGKYGEVPIDLQPLFLEKKVDLTSFDLTLENINNKPFKCKTCGKGFISGSYLKEHERIHSNERPYKCPDCNARFKQWSHLNQHKVLHTGERFDCPSCTEDFTRKSSLERHIKKKHRK